MIDRRTQTDRRILTGRRTQTDRRIMKDMRTQSDRRIVTDRRTQMDRMIMKDREDHNTGRRIMTSWKGSRRTGGSRWTGES
jgi:hypothetical protein